jgi:DNA-binding Xre family transcriptional regulator
LFEIHKQSAIEEAEETDPESKARNLTVSDLTEGFGLTEDGIRVLENTEYNQLRAATCRQGSM